MTTLMNYFASPIAGEWGDEAEDCTDGVPVLRTTNFTADGRLSYDDLTFRAIDTEKKKDKILKPGDIIIEKSGGTPKKPVGRCVYFDRDDDYDYFCSNFTAVLRANPETVNTKYLWYILQEHYKTRQCLKYQYKTNGIANLDITDYLSHIEVDLPSRDVQDKRVEAMDYSQHLLDIHQELLDIVDKAVKSRFVEMFFNTIDSIKWEKAKIEDICENTRTGPFGSSLHHDEFVDEGIFVLGIDNAVENRFSYNRMRYITPEKYEQLKRYTVKPKDVIITIMGTVGRSAVIPDDMPTAINTKHLACLTPKQEIVDSYFLAQAFQTHPEIRGQLNAQTKGAIMDGLNLTIIKNLTITVPPLSLQKEYVTFLKQADKSKLTIQKSLENLTELRESLMQEYFG